MNEPMINREIKPLTSLSNPAVKHGVKLRDSAYRKEHGQTIIDGLRETLRAYQAGVQLEAVYVCPGFFKTPLPRELAKAPLVQTNEAVFEKLAFGQRLDGVIALARVKVLHLQDLRLGKDPLVLVLEGVEKPGNLGAMVRTCDAAGVDAVIVTDPKTDVYNPNVIRASIGSVFSLPVVACSNEQAADYLKKRRIRSVAAFIDGDVLYSRADMSGPLAIVLGSEDQGLSPFWGKACDVRCRIPMRGRNDSLNVSVCAAIFIYEAIRQRI